MLKRLLDRLLAPSPEVVVPLADMAAVLHGLKRPLLTAAVFSGFINVLTLGSPLFMLQVYDRVLPSHNLDTLVAFILLFVVVFAFNAALENTRSRLFARMGAFVDRSLSDAVYTLNIGMGLPGRPAPVSSPFRDLEQLRSFLTSGGPGALFDLVWTPLYVAFMFLLHPWMGVFTLCCIALLAGVTLMTHRLASPLQVRALQNAQEANTLAESIRQSAETLVPTGMSGRFRALWQQKNETAGADLIAAADRSTGFNSLSRFLRITMQSLILALGAFLLLRNEASGGIIIAGSILLGRALAPVESTIGQWRGFVAARLAFGRLKESLRKLPDEPALRLPPPQRQLSVQQLSVGLPGKPQPLLHNVNFELLAGDGMAVLGPSGAGKSTLARALVGLLPAARGRIAFDGSLLAQWREEDAGRFLGCMSQTVELFAGTVAQNIARFDLQASDADILKAAEVAGVDRLVRGFDKGFETEVGPRGSYLSAGQRQRVALARALYGDPFVLVLDEPNAALDHEGEAALLRAIEAVRRRQGIVIVIAHRLSTLKGINKVLVLEKGQQAAFGPRDDVLKEAAARARAGRPGGAAPAAAPALETAMKGAQA